MNDEMNEKKVEILMSLHERSWENFHERRRHEYKISITVWTLYIISIWQLLSMPIKKTIPMMLFFTIFALVLLVIYLVWVYGIARANMFDRILADYYGAKLRSEASISFPPFDKSLSKIRIDHSKSESMLRKVLNWNHGSEIGVTTLLAIILIFILWM